MGLSGQQEVLCTLSEIGLVLLGEHWNRECVPAKCIGIREPHLQSNTNRSDPDPVDTGGDEGHVPEWSVVETKKLVGDYGP